MGMFSDTYGESHPTQLMQDLVQKMVRKAAKAKDEALRAAIMKHLGKDEITTEDLQKLEMIKQGNKEWLIYDGKSFGFYITELDFKCEPLPNYKVGYYSKSSFHFSNNPHLDTLLAEQKEQERLTKEAEEIRQNKLWSALKQVLIPYTYNSHTYDKAQAIIDRMKELGFKIEMGGIE